MDDGEGAEPPEAATERATGQPTKMQLDWGLGFHSGVLNTILALDDSTVLYPQGRVLARHNLETNQMSFVIAGQRVGTPLALALSPSRKHVAVCEEAVGDALPGVAYYSLQTSRRLRTLTCQEASTSRFVSAAFSQDGKQLAAVTMAPSFMLVLWTIEKGRIISCVKQPGLHTRVSFMPVESKYITLCTSGTGSLRLWQLEDEIHLKETVVSVGKRSGVQPDYNHHCWLKPASKTEGSSSNVRKSVAMEGEKKGSSTLCALTEDGNVHFFAGGTDLNQSLTLIRAVWDDQSRPPPRAIHAMACARGLLVSGADGLLALLERDSAGMFSQTRTFTCSPPQSSGGRGAATTIATGSDSRPSGDVKLWRRETTDITSMCTGSSQETLIVMTSCGQMASFPLSAIELLDPEGSHFSFNGGGVVGVHCGSINGLDCCVAKPIFATCGADCTVRVWDYANRMCLLVKELADTPLCLSLHPSGDMVAVGFADKLRLYQVLLDDLKLVAGFVAKGVREARFSHGGGRIAAVTGAHIHLFDTFTHEALGLLRGHTGLIKGVAWSADDAALVSCGHDGAVYEWDMRTRQRVVANDYVLKSAQYEAVALAPAARGGNSIPLVVAAHTGKIQGLVLGAGAGPTGAADAHVNTGAHGEVEVDARPRALCLSHADRTVIVGMQNGGLRAYAWPLYQASTSERGVIVPMLSMSAHGAPIVRIALTNDETTVISASDDGQIFVWSLLGGAAAAQVEEQPEWRREQRIRDAIDAVLISRSAMNDSATGTAELRDKLERVSAQAEYQAHVREQKFAEELRRARAEGEAALAAAEARTAEVAGEAAAREEAAAAAAEAKEAAHMRAAEELEHLYERKLALEAARYEALRRKAEEAEVAFEQEIHAAHAAARAREAQLKAELRAAQGDGEARARATRRETEAIRKKLEATIQQEEEDYDRAAEIAVQEKLASVEAEKEIQRTLRGEAAVLRQRVESAAAEAEHAQRQLALRDEALSAVKEEKLEAERTIRLLRRELTERAAEIKDLEKRMGEVKAANKELEKFKYVLDYKLREIRRDVEPKDEAIGAMRETIRELDAEMQREYASTLSLETQLAEKQTRIESVQAEARAARAELAEREKLLFEAGRQLHTIVSSDPVNWRDGVMEMYRDFNMRLREHLGEAAGPPGVAEEEVLAENHRQRMHMERALDAVKLRVGRTENQAKVDLQKKLAENQVLLSEVNSLRYENKALRRKNDQLQTQLLSQRPAEYNVPQAPIAHTRPGTPARSISKPGSASTSILLFVPPTTPPKTPSIPRPASATTLRRPSSAVPMQGSAANGVNGRPITSSASRGQLVRGRLSTAPDRHHRDHLQSAASTSYRREVPPTDVSRLREEVRTLLSSEHY